ncbi:M20/M25/M40 family metallo-hydrolase [Siccirubricoccus sp. KC 17139]|uniref:M20/M25/M40 family metallo-hydrolase n=1 Tax=Siccirubricoccus soli TaxID=2899147 RepID=A0ABT1D205_9PROT|nr:M20/M25/M40 family metallo-hydrolase [Siccirubricoccus soli]MCO6415936.1 M20/M25/M40 family metallo-hydrolase [Siccirubricoccus soli]MCP2682068.1 M20/M25/M40 family metallo-hydrolase [Siccirubricoccus soli]
MTDRAGFAARAAACEAQVVAMTQTLVAIPSPNPPGDTRAVAEAAAALIRRHVPGAEVTLHPTSETVTNLVAILRGHAPGRHLVFNGHLDTYPVNEALPWTVPPLGGLLRDGRLYGRGAADMKGGLAASIMAMALLAEHRALWRGETVLTLAGDEESMGPLGSQWLLEKVPEARGDAVIIGDAGSPRVLRFGEKGFLWIELEATGRASHGAHVHLGINALDRLCAALDAVRGLRALRPAAPAAVTAAIAAAKPVSEPLSGVGEAEVLSAVTVNIGRVEGGTSTNLVPAAARAGADIRLPVGISCATAEAALEAALAPHEGVTCRILRRFEPSHTDPGHEIVRRAAEVAAEVLGAPCAVNMRVGGSDARLHRMAGLPTIVYGPTPHNMGGADEYVLVEELRQVAQVHALTALDFLAA